MNTTQALSIRDKGQNLTPDLQQSSSVNETLSVTPDQSSRVVEGMQGFPGNPVERGDQQPDQAKESLDQHGKDVRLGREIFALAKDDEDTQPVRYIPLKDVNDEFKKASRDLAQAAHREKHLLEEAETHPVTGLPNTKACDNYLQKILQNADTKNSDVAFAMLDLDGFKMLNDTFGHALGDRILKAFGEELQKRVRQGDLVAALGGDEFGIVMPHYVRDNPNLLPEEREEGMTTHFRAAALEVLNQIKSDPEVASIVEQSGKDLVFDTSIGISLLKEGDSVTSLKQRADKAMYEDKNSRKMTNKTRRISRLLSSLRSLMGSRRDS